LSSPRFVSLAVAITLASLAASASAQFFPGGPPGGGSGPGNFLERVAFGTIEDLNPIQGYLQVQVPGGGSRIVVVGQSTKVTRMAQIPPSELKVDDEVTVSGTPTVIAADQVRLGRPMGIAEVMGALQGEKPSAEQPSPKPRTGGNPAGAGNAPGAPSTPAPPTVAMPAAPPMTPSRPGPGYSLSGRVKSVTPLVVTTAGGVDVTVVIPAGGSVLRRQDGDLSAAAVGDEVVALGDVNEDGYLAATEVHLGETISLGRMGGGMGMGGPMMGPPRGGPAPPGAQPPPTPSQGGNRE
jgi:hypothetical protein